MVWRGQILCLQVGCMHNWWWVQAVLIFSQMNGCSKHLSPNARGWPPTPPPAPPPPPPTVINFLHCGFRKCTMVTMCYLCTCIIKISSDIQWPNATGYTVKKVTGFPVPSRDVTKQTLPGREYYIIPVQGEFGWWHPGWGREKDNRFLQCTSNLIIWWGQDVDSSVRRF